MDGRTGEETISRRPHPTTLKYCGKRYTIGGQAAGDLPPAPDGALQPRAGVASQSAAYALTTRNCHKFSRFLIFHDPHKLTRPSFEVFSLPTVPTYWKQRKKKEVGADVG